MCDIFWTIQKKSRESQCGFRVNQAPSKQNQSVRLSLRLMYRGTLGFQKGSVPTFSTYPSPSMRPSKTRQLTILLVREILRDNKK